MSTDLSNLTPTKAIDVVGVYDVGFNQVFPEGSPIKAMINEAATFFKHPLEDSTNRTDHMIFDPIEIVMDVMLVGDQYRDIFKQIKQIFRDQTQLIVQTKTDTYENMYIQGMPHDETAREYDSVVVSIALAETKFSATTTTFAPESSADTDTVGRGQQEPKTPTDSQASRGSTLSRWFE